jgi:hypothetical protein
MRAGHFERWADDLESHPGLGPELHNTGRCFYRANSRTRSSPPSLSPAGPRRKPRPCTASRGGWSSAPWSPRRPGFRTWTGCGRGCRASMSTGSVPSGSKRTRKPGWKRFEPWMSTIVDPDTGQVLGVVDGRDHKGIGEWLFKRPLHWRLGVQVVAIDPSAAFRKALRMRLPPRSRWTPSTSCSSATTCSQKSASA